jgi:phytoene dehydrogenase-like protein
MRVVVIGGGVGGLTAAGRLAAFGHRVLLCEARAEVGGLASGVDAGGLSFDGGPYILLDRPGLEWAFERLGIDVAELGLEPMHQLYEVNAPGRQPVRIFLDLERTTHDLELEWPGAGRAYERFVAEMEALRRKLAALLVVSHPTVLELARRGALGAAPFLLRSLGSVLRSTSLPTEIADAIIIWTHIAGQSPDEAPSVMAFVPALIHSVGAYVPKAGMRAIPNLLKQHAEAIGVDIRINTRARRIRIDNRRVVGVETDRGDILPCDAVVSNYNGIGTYEELVEGVPDSVRRRLRAVPLQSPGLCAYVRASGRLPRSYLRFMLGVDRTVTLAVARPGAGQAAGDGDSFPMRLIAPIDHRKASELGSEGQSRVLREMIDQSWWRDGLTDAEVVASRTSRQWGSEMNLYRDSMNPSMNRRLFLGGRMRHRSPWIRGLYLAGASTHPGQWVSFCAISGVLAAEALHRDAKRR